MTPHGPEATRLVTAALEAAGLELIRPARTNVTGHALRVIEGRSTREEAIDQLERLRRELDRRTIIKALDVAVEALTANTQE